MHLVLGVLAIIFSLLLVVGLHEAGHAWVATRFKVKIKKISIGFGPALLIRQIKGCQWIWALWPLGGYVHLLNSRIEPVKPKDYPFCLDKKSLYARSLILIAGIVVNMLVAWILLTLFYMMGHREIAPVIGKVAPSSLAAKAGLSAHDELLSIAGEPVSSWHAVGMQLIMNMGQTAVKITVRDEHHHLKQSSLQLSSQFFLRHRGSLLSILGMKPVKSSLHERYVQGLGAWMACKMAFSQLILLLKYYIVILKLLITGQIPFTLLIGPLGLLSLMVHTTLQGIAMFFYFVANLSLVVAVINALPFPGLDGGSLVYVALEKIRGKPISVAMEVLLHRLMFILLILILVQLLLNDIQRIFL